MLVCPCLNVIIDSENYKNVSLDELNLSEEEKNNAFFKQEISLVQNLNNVHKEIASLILSNSVGSWIIYQCINCNVYTHAIHRERGASCVLVASKLLTTQNLQQLRENKSYSNIFNILITADKQKGIEKPDDVPSDTLLALSILKQRLTDVINREIAKTEDNVRQFTEQQYLALEEFRERANREHKILTQLILNKRHLELDLTERDTSFPTKVDFSSPKSPINKIKPNILFSPLKDSNIRIITKQASVPLPQREAIDSEGLFQLEGIDDSNDSTGDGENSDDEMDKEEGVKIHKQRTTSASVAKSLPMNIPIFRSAFGVPVSEDDEDATGVQGEYPSDIAASIKALAKSVHGDTVFGDLPKPRFSTQI